MLSNAFFGQRILLNGEIPLSCLFIRSSDVRSQHGLRTEAWQAGPEAWLSGLEAWLAGWARGLACWT